MKPLRTLLFLLSLSTGCTVQPDPHAELLEQLDRQIEQRHLYDSLKQRRIRELHIRLDNRKDPHERIAIMDRIYWEYFNYNIDSAYHYAERMLSLAEKYGHAPQINNARIYLARTLSDGGINDAARHMLDLVDTTRSDLIDMYDYYRVRQTLLRNERNAAGPKRRKIYDDSLQLFDRLCIEKLPEGSLLRNRFVAIALNAAGKSQEALDMLLPEYEAGIEETHTRALFCYALSNIYKKMGDTLRRREFLIRAAIDDLQTPVREGAAIYDLSVLLFDEGDVIRANRYINYTAEDALYCNFRARVHQSSVMARHIGEAYIRSLDAKRRTMGYVFAGVSLLSLILACSISALLHYYRKAKIVSAGRLEMNRQLQRLNRDIERQNERIRDINGELLDANSIKDEYVGHYLNLCSQYILKLNTYRKELLKIAKDAGGAALMHELRGRNPADAEFKEFLATFDETFLHLFPDFVARVNRLMVDGARFILRQPQTLNTELRILALIRLGVTNSTKIAAILNCSVSTVHTYRAQLRNAAAGDRDAFDDDIRRIDIPGSEPSA